ncbi:MAG: septum formation protein Maf [Verrucomicrobia bacterium]|nr:septum formation protein Maf [Verrucomicrobiota bacterium]MBU4428241.1 septum formation protein Maf [Verrucomicrobiota bacterium]MCG2679540.1 Maf family protein [Kiritimatiellia bacterium]
MDMQSKLILASASARRRKILTALGVAFDVVIPEVEEVQYALDARRTAHENAARKSAWCRARHPQRYSLAADTLIEFEGRCINKPQTPEAALAILQMFSGKTHRVYTAVAMAHPRADPELVLAESVVRFRSLNEDEIRAYVARVNPIDRAGAYDIDALGDTLMESYTGSRTNIMGLPEEPVAGWLKREGLL